MGKRYYCDYCDKSFADNPTSRKVHLTGSTHLANRNAHYDSFKDEKEILEADRKKKPCRAYLSTGNCKFGDRCQFSHLTNEDRYRLTEIVRQKEEGSNQTPPVETDVGGVDAEDLLKDWLDKRTKRLKRDFPDSGPSTETVHAIRVPEYKLAECLSVYSNLSPSLLPPSKESILKSEYVNWG